MPGRMGARFKTWAVPGQRWHERGCSLAGPTCEVHEVMRRDVQEGGTMTACGWTHTQKVSRKIEATSAK